MRNFINEETIPHFSERIGMILSGQVKDPFVARERQKEPVDVSRCDGGAKFEVITALQQAFSLI
ncbi:hypothetical protein [Rhizobium sp. PP-CC-3G-465]|uniref:hypothetical protein n=1 Tax=Rhizobium sp. PP-CC-3G-465 TaxID=2135648 RepID=UPI0010506A8C